MNSQTIKQRRILTIVRVWCANMTLPNKCAKNAVMFRTAELISVLAFFSSTTYEHVARCLHLIAPRLPKKHWWQVRIAPNREAFGCLLTILGDFGLLNVWKGHASCENSKPGAVTILRIYEDELCPSRNLWFHDFRALCPCVPFEVSTPPSMKLASVILSRSEWKK